MAANYFSAKLVPVGSVVLPATEQKYVRRLIAGYCCTRGQPLKGLRQEGIAKVEANAGLPIEAMFIPVA